MSAPPARFPSSRPGHPSTPWFGFPRAARPAKSFLEKTLMRARAPRGVPAEPATLANVPALGPNCLPTLRLRLRWAARRAKSFLEETLVCSRMHVSGRRPGSARDFPRLPVALAGPPGRAAPADPSRRRRPCGVGRRRRGAWWWCPCPAGRCAVRRAPGRCATSRRAVRPAGRRVRGFGGRTAGSEWLARTARGSAVRWPGHRGTGRRRRYPARIRSDRSRSDAQPR